MGIGMRTIMNYEYDRNLNMNKKKNKQKSQLDLIKNHFILELNVLHRLISEGVGRGVATHTCSG